MGDGVRAEATAQGTAAGALFRKGVSCFVARDTRVGGGPSNPGLEILAVGFAVEGSHGVNKCLVNVDGGVVLNGEGCE